MQVESPTLTTPLLDVRNLNVSFRTSKGMLQIIDNCSFTVAEGEILSIVGESGSGKSMTSLAIMRLISDPNAVVDGAVLYKGRDLLKLDNGDMQALRGSEIAMIFQDPMTAMTPVLSIGDQIIEQILAHQHVSRRVARNRCIELLGEMGVPSPARVAERYPHQLSGGLRQRAMIAMALSCSPSLLIADEPTTALDVTVQAQILELILQLRHSFGSSIILITHDMGVVDRVADRVMVMYSGRIAEQGSKASVLENPAHPYTQGLLASRPSLYGPRSSRLPSIPGSPPLPQMRPTGCAFQPRCQYAFALCTQQPPLLSAEAGHEAACHLLSKTSLGEPCFVHTGDRP
jgi:peptide/nickel transport system ATP-binding protein